VHKTNAQYCAATSYCSEYITNVNFNTINNSSSCGSGYSDCTSLSTTVWMGSSYNLSVTVGNHHFATVTNVWVDWNNNQSFADPGERLFISNFTTSTGIVSVTVPYTGVNGNVRMRVRTSYSSVTACGALTWGECEDYTLFLAGAFGCSGTPAASNTITSANPACYGQNFTLSLSTAYIDTSIIYQWQSSPDNVVWSDIVGANALNYTGSQIIETYYRCKVTCDLSGQFIYSTVQFVPLDVFTNCYCTPGTTNNTNGQEITNVTFAGINNSTGATGVNGYANFTGLGPANVTQYASIPLSVTLYDGGLLNTCAVWIDWNQNGLFEISEYINMGSGNYPIVLTQNIVVPGNAVPGPTRMRVRVRDTNIQPNQPCSAYTWGETEDYSVGVTAAVLCNGTPAATSAISSDSTMCQGVNLTLSLSTVYPFGGISFQWQSSPDGISYTDINGATGEVYVTSQTVATFYQCVVTCSNGGNFIFSTPVEVLQNDPITCHCIPPISSNPGYMWITNVNSTGCVIDLNNSSAASGSVAYTDYSATQIVSQVAGLSVVLSFTTSGYPMHEVVWVDYNNNGYFSDPGELVLTINNSGGAMVTTGSFMIPSGAQLGSFKMRVRGEYYTNPVPNNPCTGLQYGETEDYMLNVVGCAGAPATPVAIIGNNNICNGTSNIYYVAPVPDATSYTWTLPGGWSGSSITDSIAATAGMSNGDITVTANNSCGSSTAQILTVGVSSIPATPGAISGGSAVCAGSNNTFNVAPVIGATSYSWTLPNGWTGSSTTDSIVATSNSTGGDITVIANNFCGSSAAQTLTVTVSAIPATPGIISGPTTVCAGTNNGYSIVAVNDATSYTWTLPGGWSGTSLTDSIFIVAGSGGGDITVASNNFCGSSAAQTLTIAVDNIPAVPGLISGNISVCENSNNTYSITPVSGATTYTWTLPSGWNGSGTGDSITTTASVTGGVISVTAGNLCGNSANQDLTVSVNPLPIVSVSAFATACEDWNPFTLSGGTPAGGTYSGAGISSNVFSPATAGTGVHIVTYTYSDANNCSASDTSTIEVILCTGLSQLQTSGFSIYPNPFHEKFLVKSISDYFNLSVYNMIGELILLEKSESNTIDVDLTLHPQGIYLLKLEQGREVIYKKVVKE